MPPEGRLESVYTVGMPDHLNAKVRAIQGVMLSAREAGYKAVSLQYVAKEIGMSYGGNFTTLVWLFNHTNDHCIIEVNRQGCQPIHCLISCADKYFLQREREVLHVN